MDLWKYIAVVCFAFLMMESKATYSFPNSDKEIEMWFYTTLDTELCLYSKQKDSAWIIQRDWKTWFELQKNYSILQRENAI